jgi:hypothetical protein
MSKRMQIILVGLVCFLLGGLVMQSLPLVYGQPATTKKPSWMHGLDLRVRKGGEEDWGKDTKKYGIEVFKDENTGYLVYISETGSIAVVPAK